jgi:predicted dehydrogenase
MRGRTWRDELAAVTTSAATGGSDCLGIEPPSPDLQDGVQSIRLIEAMLESAASGQQVIL